MRADVLQSALVSTREQILLDLASRPARDTGVVHRLTMRLDQVVTSLAAAEISATEAWTRFGDIQSDLAELHATVDPAPEAGTTHPTTGLVDRRPGV